MIRNRIVSDRHLLHKRQKDPECRAGAGFAITVDVALMLLDDAVGDGESEAGRCSHSLVVKKGSDGNYFPPCHRMLTARAASKPITSREIMACVIIRSFAQRDSTGTSVGEKAVLVLKARNR